MTKSKNICCLFCSSGPICAQAQIQRAGYVPGETIFVNADTENNSGKDMQSSRVQLVQVRKDVYFKTLIQICYVSIDNHILR